MQCDFYSQPLHLVQLPNGGSDRQNSPNPATGSISNVLKHAMRIYPGPHHQTKCFNIQLKEMEFAAFGGGHGRGPGLD